MSSSAVVAATNFEVASRGRRPAEPVDHVRVAFNHDAAHPPLCRHQQSPALVLSPAPMQRGAAERRRLRLAQNRRDVIIRTSHDQGKP
jgi:hypothetical protein